LPLDGAVEPALRLLDGAVGLGGDAGHEGVEVEGGRGGHDEDFAGGDVEDAGGADLAAHGGLGWRSMSRLVWRCLPCTGRRFSMGRSTL